MSWFKLIEMLLALGLAGGFWLYVLALIAVPIAGLLGFTGIASLGVAFLETFILYFFISACFLLFWPDDSGPYLD